MSLLDTCIYVYKSRRYGLSKHLFKKTIRGKETLDAINASRTMKTQNSSEKLL